MRFQFRVDATFSSSVFGFVSVSYRNWSVHLFDSCLSCLRSASSRQLWPSAEHRLTRASPRSCDKAEPRLACHRIGSAELGSAATGTVEQGGGQRAGRMRLMPRSHQLNCDSKGGCNADLLEENAVFSFALSVKCFSHVHAYALFLLSRSHSLFPSKVFCSSKTLSLFLPICTV